MSPLLDSVADAVNPSLALFALAVPFTRAIRQRRALVTAYLVSTAIGIAGIYAVGALDRALGLWLRFGGDYSTHTAFATSLVASMMFWKPAWRVGLGAVLVAYLALIVFVGYHSIADVAASAVAALLVTVPGQLLARHYASTKN